MPEAPRPFVAATPANGYLVHAIRQPHPELATYGIVRTLSVCGIRGVDATGWGGFRPYPDRNAHSWVEFDPESITDNRGAAHPVCRACASRAPRIRAREVAGHADHA